MDGLENDEGGLPRVLRAVLAAMSVKERRRMGEFLMFAPFNSQRRLGELYLLAEGYFFAEKAPSEAWESVAERAGFSESQMPKLWTYLHQKVDSYLALKQVEDREDRQAPYTMEAYRSLGLRGRNLEKKYRQLRKRIERERMGLEHFQNLQHLDHQALELWLASSARMERSQFADMHALLDLKYLLGKLKYACATINEAQLMQLPYPDSCVAQVRGLLEGWKAPLPAFGRAYEAVFSLQTMSAPMLKDFVAVTDVLKSCLPEVARIDCWDLFHYLLNQAYPRMSFGVEGLEAWMVEVYEFLISNELLSLDGPISSRVFKNVVSLYCLQKRFEAARQFISTYAERIDSEDRKLLPTHCTGLVEFYDGNYKEAAQAFRRVMLLDPEDHIWGVESRNMLLKANFHLWQSLTIHEHEEMLRLIDAFKMFLRRNSKLDAFRQEAYMNFIHIYGQMVKCLEMSGDGVVDYPNSLLAEVDSQENLVNRPWLSQILKGKKE